MTVLYLILPLMLSIATGAVVAFVWAARRGQLDDLDTPPLRILADDEPAWPPTRNRRTVAQALSVEDAP
jgi:cbb3-type cytochrome oxidase maturation protein